MRTSRPASVLAALGMVLVAVACGSSSSGDPAASSGGPSPDAGAIGETPTFKKDVEPLVQAKCQNCHREGGIAPFSLVTYDEVKTMAELARKRIEARTMPPWGAYDSDACKMQHAFLDDLRLSDAQVALFGRWVDGGMPLGDPALQNPTPEFPPTDLATKTSSFQMPAAYSVPGGTGDDIECFPIDPAFAADTWISGVNVVPGNRQIVHHVIVYTDPNGDGAKNANGSDHYKCFGGPGVTGTSVLMAWAPGARPIHYDDAGIKVAAGSKLVMQVHYHPTPDTQQDRSAFQVEVRPDKPKNVLQLFLIGNARSATDRVKLLPGPDDPPEGPAFYIPPNAKAHTESMEFTIPEKLGGFPVPTLSLATVGAHMHWAGVDMKIEIARSAPAGQPANECLLGTPKYDFNWQRGYQLAGAMEQLPTIQAGDTLRFTCTYDNTLDNPNVRKALAEQKLPAPVGISLGETTLDEMCLGVIAVMRPATIVD